MENLENSDSPQLDKINYLFELTRNFLIQSEAISEQISQLKNSKLRQHLTSMLQTCQADLLILNDFLYEASTCEDSDIDSLIDCAADDHRLTNDTTYFEN